MIAVDLITEQELDKRFDTLSSKLKDTLTSERSLSVVDQICKKNNIIDEEKVLIIHQIVGLVILGLIHSYDLGSEINEDLSLENPKFSNAIAEELNAKVFLSIKTELENNYRPINSVSLGVKDISSKQAPVTPNSTATTTTIAASTPKPATLSDIGWSKQPAPAARSSANINIPKPASTTIPVPATNPAAAIPKPAAEPAPMMLHEDTTFKPVEKNVSFTLSKPGGAVEMSVNHGGVPQAPTRSAVLEFGGATSAAGTSVPKPSTLALSSVRSMGFGPSFASMPTANIGSRNVSQIMPAASALVPTPPKNFITDSVVIPIPRPPQVSQPPAPPQPNKPIVKDFP